MPFREIRLGGLSAQLPTGLKGITSEHLVPVLNRRNPCHSYIIEDITRESAAIERAELADTEQLEKQYESRSRRTCAEPRPIA